MEPVKFRVRIKSPIALTLELQRDIYCSIIPKYRLLSLEFTNINRNVLDLVAYFHPEDINPKTEVSELLKIRDMLLSLLSITKMIPVELSDKGVFTFPLGNKKYKALSLGPMNKEAAPVVLHSLDPLIKGQSLLPKYVAAVYYIWQAINADEALYRFINTAISVELLAGADSPDIRTISPKCTCNYILEKCPNCNRDWTIPNSLRNRAKFLINDNKLLTRFVNARNNLFHGGLQQQDAKFLRGLSEISVPVLLAVRNFIGGKIGLAPMKETDLSISFHHINVTVGVFYTIPEADPD